MTVFVFMFTPYIQSIISMHSISKTLRLTSCVLAVHFASITHAAILDCELNGQSVSPNNGSTTAGKTGLMRCVDRDTKQLAREEELREGKFMGLSRFYKDGVLEREHSVNEKGNRDGRSREFGKNGQVLRDETYRNGSTTGLARSWYESGTIKRVTFYGSDNDNDKGAREREQAYAEFTTRKQLSELRCGSKPLLAPEVNDAALCGFEGKPSTVEMFSDSGTLRKRAVLLAGTRTKLVGFHDNGKPSYEEELNAERYVERNFSPEGVKRKEVQWKIGKDKKRLREREQLFHESGALTEERMWQASEAINESRLKSESMFYLNGQPRSKISYTQEGKDDVSEEKHFHDNGQLASQGRYISEGRYRSRATGTHQTFNTKGKLVAENLYDNKGRITRERAWDEAGQLVRDDEVFEDGSRKAYAK
jgi:antitoxin component YwqK of YwqJK toxin-antitoxin module